MANTSQVKYIIPNLAQHSAAAGHPNSVPNLPHVSACACDESGPADLTCS